MAKTKSVDESRPLNMTRHPNEILRMYPKKPVDGYVFVPTGDVYVSRHWYCTQAWLHAIVGVSQSSLSRDLTHQAGLSLYIVYHKKSRKKLGLDCPESILKAVTLDAEASAEKHQHAVEIKDQRDREASRALLQRLFPHMPATSMETILDHGFAKGSGRVGRTKTLDEAAKANLAVNAHIRDNHTAYDSLYSTMKSDDKKQDVKVRARMAVYKQVQRIAETWRTGITNSDVKPIDLKKSARVSKQESDINSTVSNHPEMHHTNSDADVAMEDVDRVTSHPSQRVKRPGRRVASGGVQKTLKVERTRPTRIQPKRGLAALDAALASMDLNQAISVANPEVFKIALGKPDTSKAQPQLCQQKIAVTANMATIRDKDSSRWALYVPPKSQRHSPHVDLEQYRSDNNTRLSRFRLSDILESPYLELTSEERQNLTKLRDRDDENERANAERKKIRKARPMIRPRS